MEAAQFAQGAGACNCLCLLKMGPKTQILVEMRPFQDVEAQNKALAQANICLPIFPSFVQSCTVLCAVLCIFFQTRASAVPPPLLKDETGAMGSPIPDVLIRNGCLHAAPC